MRIHKEGIATIILGLTLFFGMLIFAVLITEKLWLQAILIAPFIAIFLLILWFFRIPERTVVKNNNLLYAPADGKVVVIEKTLEVEYFKDERIQVSIFMSPLNVHQNIYPFTGEVTYTKYHKGKFLVAWHPKSSTLNERSTVVVKHPNGTEILIRQIAGAVARRIVTYSKKGDKVTQGNEFGFIKFGSRVDIFLPLGTEITCSINQIVENKLTAIAKLG
jgi:phosphatidylserine decarboxylase